MKIAIIGTHCSGKTTLAEDFLAVVPGHRHEPEPYEQLSDVDGAFPEEPTFDDFMAQIEFSVGLLDRRATDRNVVFERCPIDLAAYAEVLGRADGSELPAALLEEAAEATRLLELVVFLPLKRPDPFAAINPELPRLRIEVDRAIKEIVRGDRWDLFGDPAGTRLIEVAGPREVRLRALMDAVASS